MAAAGIIGFNSEAQPQQPSNPTTIAQPPLQPPPSANCQFSTSYNVTVNDESSLPHMNMSPEYPPQSSTHKPTLADTACNRHMCGEAIMLDNLHDIDPVSINVANTDESSRIIATKMGTARLHAFALEETPSFIDIHNILYSPSLPENLISITQLYNAGFKTVDPHFGNSTVDTNLYYSDLRIIVPAYKDGGPRGF